MKLNQRIRLRREELGYSQDDLAQKLGYKSRSTIAKIESGENDITQAKINAFAQALHCTPAYLMGLEEREAASNVDFLPPEGICSIPIIASVAAGFGGDVCEDYEGSYFAFGLQRPEEYRYFRVHGDSMLPKIEDGDLALVHMQPMVDNGDLAVVVVNEDEGLIKKVHIKQDTLTLASFNPEYAPRVYVREQMNDVHIYGKVVRITRDYE